MHRLQLRVKFNTRNTALAGKQTKCSVGYVCRILGEVTPPLLPWVFLKVQGCRVLTHTPRGTDIYSAPTHLSWVTRP